MNSQLNNILRDFPIDMTSSWSVWDGAVDRSAGTIIKPDTTWNQHHNAGSAWASTEASEDACSRSLSRHSTGGGSTGKSWPTDGTESASGLADQAAKPAFAQGISGNLLAMTTLQSDFLGMQMPESGVQNCTTFLLRPIPCTFMHRDLISELKATGFHGLYDFLYIPKSGHKNRGLAFINFVNAGAAEAFCRNYSGQSLRAVPSEPLEVLPAHVQGFKQNVERFQLGKVTEKHAVIFRKPRPAAERAPAAGRAGAPFNVQGRACGEQWHPEHALYDLKAAAAEPGSRFELLSL